jgi:hypothetical protein
MVRWWSISTAATSGVAVVSARLPHLRQFAALSVTTLVASLLTAGPAPAAPNHPVVVGAVPSSASPDIIDGTVFAIHDAGTKVVAAGSFTAARDRDSDVDISRPYVLAFDKATGAVDAAFAPRVDGEVRAVTAGPTAGTVFLAGRFNTVNGVTRRKVALLDLADGALVAGFAGPAFNGLVNDVALVGDRLLVGGVFTTAGAANPRGGLASLDATTGALDTYLTTKLTVNHNWDGVTGAKAGVGADRLAVSPDGAQVVVIGNFKQADGVEHDQVVKLALGQASATIADWNTDRYAPRCRWQSYDTYMRDVAFSPDGAYFVIVTTGAPHPDTLCDAVARWEADATGADAQPTWVGYSGGDSIISVGISEQAVYVGGHIRWMNNSFGTDEAEPGAVGRASIAALDPVNGLPLAWNPGRHPRGYGVAELLVTPEGLWLGSDQAYLGNFEHHRERIAFLPLAGGTPAHSTATATLPGNVYLAGPPDGTPDEVSVRAYDGAGTVGPPVAVANPDATAWSSARAGFWVGGTLFYAMDGALHRRSFDGTAFGPATEVDPYHDPYWDEVVTDSEPPGQTYAGATVNFYRELSSVTGMFYAAGRLYYTLDGRSGLFWRWFTPDSGIVGADKFTVAGAGGFADAGAVFVSGDSLYVVSLSTGNLSSTAWVAGSPSGPTTVVSGPEVDGMDWRANAVFVGP